MSTTPTGPPYDQLLATAETVAAERPEVDLEMAREVFAEAATLLHNGLVLDGLDDHDANAMVAGLCLDLVAPDPGSAIRARAQSVTKDAVDLHDPEAVADAYLVTVSLFRL